MYSYPLRVFPSFLYIYIYIYIYIIVRDGGYPPPLRTPKSVFSKPFFITNNKVIKLSTHRIFSRQYNKEKRTCSPKIVSCISFVLNGMCSVLNVFSIKHDFYNSPNEERRFRFLYNCVLPRFSRTKKKVFTTYLTKRADFANKKQFLQLH